MYRHGRIPIMAAADVALPAPLAGRSEQELARAFAGARAPDPAPDGRYDGALLALTLAPGVDALLELAIRAGRPWLGKRFDAPTATGANVLAARWRPLGRRLLPGRYRTELPEDEEAFRSLPFVTAYAGSRLDPAHEVLRIDYDLPRNPPGARRVVDELVVVEPGVLLGQALWRLPVRAHRLAWFALWPRR
jgi:hypothetical protein